MPVFEGNALQQISGICTPASVAASCIADSFARDVYSTIRETKKTLKTKRKVVPEEVLEHGRRIGLYDLCWMPVPKSPDNKAHLCLLIQSGQGKLLLLFLKLISSILRI